MTKKLFGTDGVRGAANRFPMTPEVALSLGQAIAYYFATKRKGEGKIVIGKDTRRSSYMFEYALSAGISSMGCKAILTGPLPTPGIAFITTAMRADAGVVISASHNLYSDNGIKFFDNLGFKLPDEVETQMEEFVSKPPSDSIRPMGADIGRAVRVDDAVGRYVEFLKSTFPRDLDLTGLKIVVDCANGAGYHVGPILLSEMGAKVIAIGDKPDGVNINDNCGALYPQTMARMVKEHGADIGLAVDGDADRIVIADEKGNLVHGDQIIALCALERKQQDKLAHNTVVGTIMSNMGLEVFLRDQGIHFIRTLVGDRFVSEAMRKGGYTVGGEPSGHLIFMDLTTTGDGLLAGLQVLRLMKTQNKPLSELIHAMPLYPQVSRNIIIKEKKDLGKVSSVQKELKDVQGQLDGYGRVILRYSGTEPLLRLMIEGKDFPLIETLANRLELCLRENLA